MKYRSIEQVLVEGKFITAAQLEQAQRIFRQTGERHENVRVRLNALRERQVMEACLVPASLRSHRRAGDVQLRSDGRPPAPPVAGHALPHDRREAQRGGGVAGRGRPVQAARARFRSAVCSRSR